MIIALPGYGKIAPCDNISLSVKYQIWARGKSFLDVFCGSMWYRERCERLSVEIRRVCGFEIRRVCGFEIMRFCSVICYGAPCFAQR